VNGLVICLLIAFWGLSLAMVLDAWLTAMDVDEQEQPL
jgi:hypothetical protein